MPSRDVSESRAESIRKILVLRFSSLGDVVMTTAMVRSLRRRFPTARIDFAVREDFLALLDKNPALDRVFALPRRGGWKGLVRFTKELRAENYDLVYDAHRSLRSRFMLPWLKAKFVRRFSKHYLRRALALTFKLPLLDGRRFLDRFIDPLKDLGVREDVLGPEVHYEARKLSAALAKLRLGAPPPQGWIALIPSAQWPGKRWPENRFHEVLQKLLASTPYDFVIFGGPEDHFCQTIETALPNSLRKRVHQGQGLLDLREAIALLSTCRFTIANDTGMMHVADALHVPSVLIFGPTSSALGCEPFHPLSIVVENKLWCRPCSKNGEAPCIRSQRFCLTLTDASRVAEAALTLDRRLSRVSHG